MTPDNRPISATLSLFGQPVLAVCAIGFTALAFCLIDILTLKQTCLISLLVAGACAIAVAASATRDARFLPLSYFFIVFLVFHYGLTPQLALGADTGLLSVFHQATWLKDEHNVKLALTACNFFSTSFSLATIFGGNNLKQSSTLPHIKPISGKIALALMITSISIWIFTVVFIGGVRNYLMYNLFFSTSPTGGTVSALLNTSIAATFFFAAVNMKKPYWPLAIYVIWAAIAFPLGLRGNVLLPLALTIPVLIARGRMRLAFIPMMIGAGVLLTLIALVGGSRTGIQSLSAALEQASPMRGLAELGSSLRPVREVQLWLSSGDSLRWGETYWVPFERLLSRIIPIGERLESRQDFRLMNVLVQARVGPIGFSMVAEAVINFGLFGAAAAGALVGMIGRSLSETLVTNSSALVAPALMYALLFHVRQGFTGAFGTFFIFLAILMAVSVLEALIRSGSGTAARLPHGDFQHGN